MLWRTSLVWRRAIREALDPYGLTHVQFVLIASIWWLSEQGGPPTQREVGAQAGTDAMMTSQVLRRLEQAKLVRRRVDKLDSRARRVMLTAKSAGCWPGPCATCSKPTMTSSGRSAGARTPSSDV